MTIAPHSLVPKLCLGTHIPEAPLRGTSRGDEEAEAELREEAFPRRPWERDRRRTHLLIGVLTAVLFMPALAEAGTGRQTTTFLVEANVRTVCRWIEHHSAALDESSGAEVLSFDGRISKLRKETKEGTFTLVFDHEPEQSTTNQQCQFRTVLVKSDNPTLISQETKIRVEPEGSGSRVTITAVATVSTHSAMSIALGIRPALRGMRKLLENHFGSPND